MNKLPFLMKSITLFYNEVNLLQKAYSFISLQFLFYIRRVLLVVVILSKVNYQSFQLLSLNITSLLILLMLTIVRPYSNPRLNVSMVIFEGINLITLDFMQAFTDFSQSAADRMIIAWVILSIMFASALVNTLLVVKLSYKYLLLIKKRNFLRSHYRTVKLQSLQTSTVSLAMTST